MAHDFYFFFSYARGNRRNADRERPDGSKFNLIDQFFERLCLCLSDMTGVSSRQVGYRDISSLDVSAPWSQELAHAMQASQVLIALISPHYLKSLNCGREFQVFLRRYDLLKGVSNGALVASPILPIFWMNSDDCWQHATERARGFLTSVQLTGPGLPEDYPALGVSGQCELAKPQAYSQLCLSIARRIKQLAERQPALPALEEIGDFRELPSAFDPEQTDDQPVERRPAPVFDLGDMPPPPGVLAASAPPGLHLGP